MLLIHIKEALRLGGSPCYLYAPFRHSSLYYCTSLSCGKLSDGLKCPTCLGILCSHFSPKVRPLPWTFPESKLQVLSVLRPTTLCGVLSSPRLDSAWGWERAEYNAPSQGPSSSELSCFPLQVSSFPCYAESQEIRSLALTHQVLSRP